MKMQKYNTTNALVLCVVLLGALSCTRPQESYGAETKAPPNCSNYDGSRGERIANLVNLYKNWSSKSMDSEAEIQVARRNLHSLLANTTAETGLVSELESTALAMSKQAHNWREGNIQEILILEALLSAEERANPNKKDSQVEILLQLDNANLDSQNYRAAKSTCNQAQSIAKSDSAIDSVYGHTIKKRLIDLYVSSAQYQAAQTAISAYLSEADSKADRNNLWSGSEYLNYVQKLRDVSDRTGNRKEAESAVVNTLSRVELFDQPQVLEELANIQLDGENYLAFENYLQRSIETVKSTRDLSRPSEHDACDEIVLNYLKLACTAKSNNDKVKAVRYLEEGLAFMDSHYPSSPNADELRKMMRSLCDTEG